MLCGLKSWQTFEHVKRYKTSVIFDVNDILSLFLNGFESKWFKWFWEQRAPKKSSAGILTQMYLHVQGQHNFSGHSFFFFFFSAQVCTWIGVNDFGWSCRWFRTISSYAWGLSGSTPGLRTLSWKFCCNFSSQLVLVLHHCCMMMSWY